MNYNFTDHVRKVLGMAREEAIGMQHDYIGTEHILLGIIREGEGVASAVLANLAVDPERIRERIGEAVRQGTARVPLGELPYTSRAKKVLEFAMAESRELNHSYVGTEHLLLGLIREDKGVAAEVLLGLGVSLEEARRQTLILLGYDSAEAQVRGGAGPAPAASSQRRAGSEGGSGPSIRQIAEAFSRHDFAFAAPYFATDMVWETVGEERVEGLEAIVASCVETEKYLSMVSTKFTSLRLFTGPGWVIVDSTAEYVDEGLEISVVASCDIYRFAGMRIIEIKSYNIETGRN